MLHVLDVLSRRLLPSGCRRLKVHNQIAPISFQMKLTVIVSCQLCKTVRQKACDSKNLILDVIRSSALSAAHLLYWCIQHETLL